MAWGILFSNVVCSTRHSETEASAPGPGAGSAAGAPRLLPCVPALPRACPTAARERPDTAQRHGSRPPAAGRAGGGGTLSQRRRGAGWQV